MKRSHWMTAAAAALALATFAPAARTAPVPSDKSPLALAPASAPLVIHLKSPEALVDDAVAFLKNAVPDRADMVEKQAKDFLENGFDGRKLRGIAKDGHVLIVFTELPTETTGPDNPPKMAVLVPVTGYAEFRDNILSDKEKKSLKTEDGYESAVADNAKHNIFFVDKKDYAVIAPSKDVAAVFVQKGTGAAGMDGKMSKVQAAKFLASDLGVYLSMDVFNKQYADQIKAAREGADDQIKQLENTLGKSQKAQMEVVKKILPAIFQAVEDSQGALLTVEVRPGGVSLHTESELRAGSKTADLFKGAKPSAFKDLGKLPAGDIFYSGMNIDPALLQFAGSIVTGFSADPDSKGAKDFTEAFDQWVKAGPTEAMGAMTYPVAGLNLTKCSDPQKAVEASAKMLEAMGAEGVFQNVAFKDKPEVKPNAEKYKDISFTSIRVTWDLDKMFSQNAAGPALPDATKKQLVESMKKMMGESMNMWVGVDGKTVVQATAKDWESAQKTLDAYYKGDGAVGDDKAFAAARKELPDEAGVVVLVDAVQYVGVILDFVRPIIESSGAPIPAKFPKPVKGKTGYVGFAVTLEPTRGGFDMSITSDAVKQIYQGYVSPLLPKD